MKEKLCVQEHIESDLREYLLEVRRPHAFRHTAYSDCIKDFFDLFMECGLEWGSCHLRIQHYAESGKDSSGTELAIDIVAEGLIAHFRLACGRSVLNYRSLWFSREP
jgi:hypothetical protein